MTPSNNTILITGGTSGIGLALAQAMAAQGNKVIITGRRQAALAAITAANPAITGYALDVDDTASIASFAAMVTVAHPDLNVLINNAGIMRAEELSGHAFLADAEEMITTNLLGPIRMVAALMPHLAAQPRATVINVSSGLAFVPLVMTPTYSATKAAIHSWTQSLREQMKGTSVEVLELAPPAVQTELMPGQSASAHAMPLDAFIAEVMRLLAQEPTPAEVCVERVGFLRDAEREGRFAQVFEMLNGMWSRG
ncbi:MAG: SDR family oxidoreductase [Paracoccaceae bacterium]